MTVKMILTTITMALTSNKIFARLADAFFLSLRMSQTEAALGIIGTNGANKAMATAQCALIVPHCSTAHFLATLAGFLSQFCLT